MGCFATVSALGAVLTWASGGDDQLTIGVEDAFPPYVMQSADAGLQGFDIDLMTDVCSRAQFSCKWQTTTFDQLIPGVRDGRFDVVLGGMAITQERLALVDFTIPYLMSDDLEWYVGLPGASRPEAARIAVQSGTLHETYLRSEGLNLQTYPTEEVALQAVADGRADLAFGPFETRNDLAALMDANGMQLLYSVNVPNLGTGIALCKGNADLLTRLNGVLDVMIEDGTLHDLELRWF